MPKTWYMKVANRINPDDSDEIIAKKEFYNRICSSKKPYFFMYNYSNLKTEYDSYVLSKEHDFFLRFGKTLEEAQKSSNLTEDEKDFIEIYHKYLPLDISPGTINRTCWEIEKEFDGSRPIQFENFNYSILKSNITYSKRDYDAVYKIYQEFNSIMKDFAKNSKYDDEDKDNYFDRLAAVEYFKEQCSTLNLSPEALCDIVVDMCYSHNRSKQFVWDICGEQIVKNLLKKSENVVFYPVKDDSGDIEFKGEHYSMVHTCIGGMPDE